MAVKLDLGFMTFDLREIPAYSRRAEELGVGALWSAETRHDPFLPLAVAAANTSHIQLGTAIAVAFPRSPMVLANTAWDLQKASGGRFVLGLGTQVKAHNLRRFSVAWEPPGPTRTYQAVLAVHDLDHLVPQLHAKSLEGDWQGMTELISDETLDHFAVTATWETLAGKLRERYDGICDRTQLYPAFQPSLDDPRLQALIREMN